MNAIAPKVRLAGLLASKVGLLCLAVFLSQLLTIAAHSTVSWTTVPLTNVAVVHDIIFDGSRFLLAGWNGGTGYVLASERGTNFTTLCSTTNGPLTSVCANDGKIVAVGFDGLILFSDDGTNWSKQTSGVTYILWKVIAGNGRFIAFGIAGQPLISTNGLTWQPARPGDPDFLDIVSGGFWKDEFIGFGGERDPQTGIRGSGISVSTDGFTWNRMASGGMNIWAGLGTDGETALATGYGGAIATSHDATNWTTAISGTTTDLETATKNEAGWIVAGKDGTILFSPDGTDWESSSSPVRFELMASAFGNGKTLLGGVGTQLVVSSDVPNFGALDPSAPQIDFVQTPVGSNSSVALMITNSGTVPFDYVALGLFGQDSDQFQIDLPVIWSVSPGAVVSVTLSFAPKHVGTSWSRLTVAGYGQFYVKKVLQLRGEAGFPTSYTPARARFLVQDLFAGTAISGAHLELGEVGVAITDSKGLASLQVPQAIPCRVSVSKPGFLTRHAFIQIFNPLSNGNLPITLINQSQPQFNLGAFKRLLFNSQGIGPSGSTRWMIPPDVYVDTRPDPTTGDTFSPADVEHLLTNAPSILFELTGGFVCPPALRSGTNPPLTGAMTYRLDSINSGVGGGSTYKELRSQTMSLASSALVQLYPYVAHETAHAIGFGHTSGSGIGSIVSGRGIFWPLQLPFYSAETVTDFDRLMGIVLYSRPPGSTTTEDIADPTELDSVLWPTSDTFGLTDTALRLSCQRAGDGLILCISSRPGDLVQIQTSSDLAVWQDLMAVTLERRYAVINLPNSATGNALFFRAWR